MTAHELQVLRRSAQPPTLLHVLPEEVFSAARIPVEMGAELYAKA